ncbi:thiamine-phosphate kinase [Nocardiopsis sp. CNT312]|uniref:thiamine-phosphate kinase n=1 Tax=Nocardiopsis sp. CNT312 TaxID=1137268 RepID=UPI00048E5683|nr:thiamine-phosphate kinase [Nocardiopsis sp. CNT312]
MLSTIGGLGEFALIARVTGGLPTTDDVILGPGDDAAVVASPDGRTVATTDMLVEGRHFTREWSSARDVGHRAVAQNFADVVAMGARPTGLLVGFAAPPDLPVSWAEEFASGAADECSLAGGAVVGGDTVSSETLTIGITALGDLEGRAPVRRDGARPGDAVACYGRLGLSAAGLALLQQGADGPEECLAAYRRPRPPYAQGPIAARSGATAMLDVSDGLVQDLGHVCRASGVRIDLVPSALRPAPALLEAVLALGADRTEAEAAARELMVGGGEDHALAATFPPGDGLPAGWTRLGTVEETTEPGTDPVTVGGRVPRLRGWDHFRQR